MLKFEIPQDLTLTVVPWPEATKNSKKQLRASKKLPHMVLQDQ